MARFAERRAKMVDRQLRRRGITDERVLAAMAAVPRELFVPEGLRRRAYADEALPIGSGQTISQPWIVAATLEGLALEGGERVLEVGGGSGFTAALLVRLAAHVTSVELVPELVTAARRALILAGADLDRIELISGDGSAGYAPKAPYDAIALHAAVPAEPTAALRQLTPGGHLVAPVAAGGGEMLTVYWRDPGGAERFASKPIAACRFVPMLGAEGFGP